MCYCSTRQYKVEQHQSLKVGTFRAYACLLREYNPVTVFGLIGYIRCYINGVLHDTHCNQLTTSNLEYDFVSNRINNVELMLSINLMSLLFVNLPYFLQSINIRQIFIGSNTFNSWKS